MTIRYRRGEHLVGVWYAASHVSRATISCRFRIGHFSELLPGVSVVVGPHFPEKLGSKIRTLVCIRPFVDEAMMAQLDRLRARGVRLVADFDDLLFTGQAEQFPSVVQGHTPIEQVRHRMGIYNRGLAYFDAFLASTEQLARHLRNLRPGVPVDVVPNGLSRGWVQAGRHAAHRYQDGDARIIRYFAGSPTHDADLALVAEPLARFMREEPDVRLELAGHFDVVPEVLPRERVRLLPMRPYSLLPMLIAPTWVNLAPLAPTPFAMCKSDIKFLEAGAFGVPTIASDGPVYGKHHEAGLLACKTSDHWLESLRELAEPSARARASARAEATVARLGFADQHVEQWLAATVPGDAA